MSQVSYSVSETSSLVFDFNFDTFGHSYCQFLVIGIFEINLCTIFETMENSLVVIAYFLPITDWYIKTCTIFDLGLL